MKMDVDLQLDVFDSKISLVLECFCIFTIAIAFLLIIIVCVMNFIFYFSPKPLTKCDRGEKCIRKRPAQEPIKRNNATNTFVYEMKKNGVQTRKILEEPLFLEHLI